MSNSNAFDALDALDKMPNSTPKGQSHAAASYGRKNPSGKSKSTKSGKKSSDLGIFGRQTDFGKIIGRIVRGDVLGGETMKKQVWLIMLIGFYCLVMVGMRYQVEGLQKEKNSATDRINYIKEHKVQMQSQYQESIKISNIAQSLESTGVGLTSGPPYEI